MSADDFKKLIQNDELIEWQEVYPGHYYGTLKSEVERIWSNGHHVIFDVDVEGGINLKKLYPGISLSLFIMPPSLAELENRLRARSTETEEKLAMRLRKAAGEISKSGAFDRIIINDDLDTAVTTAIREVSNFLGS
jgi:guanylate kinase